MGFLPPLNSRRGFVGDAVDDCSDLPDLVGHAPGDCPEEIIGQFGELGGETVDTPDRPNRHDKPVDGIVTLGTSSHRLGDYGASLPDGVVEVPLAQFLYVDVVSSTGNGKTLGIDLAFDAYHQTGAGEGMALKQLL